MRRIALMAMLPAGVAGAQEFTPMTGEDILEALVDRKLAYVSAWQEFHASGRTLYNAGEDSWGYWQVQGDLYCSQWPPRSDWDCYEMARAGDVIRFIGPAGDVTDGRYAD